MPQEAPPQIAVKGLADYLDVLTKAVFQSGISWEVVEAKWVGTREAFVGFDPEHVADLTPDEIDALVKDTRLIRNRAKIEATVQNAATMLDLDQSHKSFRRSRSSVPTLSARWCPTSSSVTPTDRTTSRRAAGCKTSTPVSDRPTARIPTGCSTG